MSERIEVRALETGDAASLLECFGRCYQGTHVAEWLDDLATVVSRVEAGREYSVVAVEPSGRVMGHMALTPRETGALTAELGTTFVDPTCRGQNVSGRLTLELMRRCVEMGLVGFLHYPTTAHPAMQKLAEKAGGVTLGVLLDYIPAGTKYVGFESRQAASRVAVVAAYHELAPAPKRRVWVPARHAELIASLYARIGLARELAESRSALPDQPTQLAARFEERRGLLKIDVRGVGADLCDRVLGEIRKAPEVPVMLDLRLAEPAVDAATEALADAGFCFAALLPEYVEEGDALRLQRLPVEPAPPGLETAAGRNLFEYSLADWRR